MIFRNKKAELVKDKALIEIEDFSQKMLDKMNFGFNVMQERDDYKELYELERTKNKELENKVKEKSEKITNLNYDLIRVNKNMDKLFEYLGKLAVVVKDNHENFIKEIEDLKSDRYLVVKQRATKATTQKIGIKSGTKNGNIMKKIKGE
jgi:hypothetical protein